jgi:hypothetical protein
MHEEIVRLQQNLKTDLEAKDTASRLRIKNFYKTRIGKMQPETFQCIKEMKSNKDIHTLLVDGALVTDPERIVSIMQAWYEETAERALPQIESLDSFLSRHHFDLPQIGEDQKRLMRSALLVPRDTQLPFTNSFFLQCHKQ